MGVERDIGGHCGKAKESLGAYCDLVEDGMKQNRSILPQDGEQLLS